MTFTKDMAIMLAWFVVECGSDDPSAVLIKGIHHVADQFHAYMCACGDNLEKVAFDALTKCGAISDDRYIKYHTNRAVHVPEKIDERTEYTVQIVGGV